MELSILNLFLVLLVAWAGGWAATRLGYPSVLGELIIGILLGPPLLGLLEGSEALALLAHLGILLMMLYIGMEINPGSLRKASTGGLLAALGGFITPFVFCYFAVIWAGGNSTAGMFVGMAAGVTSLATKSRILVDLKLLDTRVAHVMMVGALIADTLSLLIFAALIGVAEVGSVDARELGLLSARVIGFFVVVALAGRAVLPLLFRKLQESKILGRTGRFTMVVIVALLFAELAEVVGLHGILGTFLTGLFLQEETLGRSAAREMRDVIQDASLGFLAPIFFVTAGFAVSLDVFSTDLVLLLSIVGLAIVGKVVGTMLFYLPTGHGWREGLTIGAGMNGRGAVEIIVAQIGLGLGLISQEIFSILVFMAIATTAMTPRFLKWGTVWLRNRGELVRSGGEREGVLILGAGPTARTLAEILARTQPVRLLDRNAEHCMQARNLGLQAEQGSGLDEETLSRVQAASVRHFIALTDNAEVNALVAQVAKTVFLVPEVHVLSNGEESHEDMVEHLRATTAFAGPISLKDWDYRIDHDEVERTGVSPPPEVSPAQLFDVLQRDLATLPLAVRRGDTYLPFHSGLSLDASDRLITLRFQEASWPHRYDRFDRLAALCPFLDIERSLSLESFFCLIADVLAPRLQTDASRLAEMFQGREASSSTVLLPGVAIPHVVVEGSGRFEMVIARCRSGIQFPGQAEGVYTVFALAGSADERNFHLRALSAIAQIIQWPDFERDWMMASDPEALRSLVRRSVRRRLPGLASTGDPATA